MDKLDELGVDQFGYGARHFIVRLGKESSGARYDNLKTLQCEVQVRTVVQDAWAIIQHHMVYKRESQVPTQLQRKLNSLAGLFETVDDQFERIREEREAYVAEVRGSIEVPAAFLKNELNLDSFKEYLRWRFPNRAVEKWDGQARLVLDALVGAGYKSLLDLEQLIVKTSSENRTIQKALEAVASSDDLPFPSNIEPAIALSLLPDGRGKIPWTVDYEAIVAKHRKGASQEESEP